VSIFSLDELVLSVASVPPPAVSIHLPTHRPVPETLHDPIRFVVEPSHMPEPAPVAAIFRY
jgi:hypothetical protein